MAISCSGSANPLQGAQSQIRGTKVIASEMGEGKDQELQGCKESWPAIAQQQLQLNLVSEDKRKVSHAMIELLRDNARKRDEASAAFEQKAAAKQRMKVSPAILLTGEQGKAYLEEKEAARQAKAEKKKRKVEGDAGTGKGSAKKRKSAAAASSGAASSGAQSSAGSSNGKNEVAMDVDVPDNASASSASGQANAGAGKKRTAAKPASKQPAKRQRPIRDAAQSRPKSLLHLPETR